ncbi:MAG: hypothetical protein E7338_05220 [Clostridiales bacterium]|nr:hypothetical protein [Clostridiales bacterium]
MKYIFIANPNAGKKDALDRINNEINSLTTKIEYDIHATTGKKDAENFVREYSKKNPDEDVCFIACGGDGTISEIANGLVGTKNKCFAILAYGSGNDFIKYYKGKDFLSLQKIVDGTRHTIDILKIDDGTGIPKYSVNVTNFGLDSVVCSYANKLKDQGKSGAYTKGVIRAIFIGRYNDISVDVDGECVTGKRLLLGTLANAHYVGSKYFTAPYAKNDDGIIDVLLYKSMPLFKFASLLNAYIEGKHLEEKNVKKAKKYIFYKKTSNPIKVYSKKPFELCLDGEMLPGTEFYVSIIPGAIDFIIPHD